MIYKLPEQAVEDYQHKGAVVLPGLFSDNEIGKLTEAIEANIADPSWRHKVASSSDDPGWFMEDFCTWQENLGYRWFIEETALSSAASQLMQSKEVRLFHDHMRVKEPGTFQRTPWHQDQPIIILTVSRMSVFGFRWTLCPESGRWNLWQDRT